ncbi:GDSL-type esterase/lipase family protein [Flavobacterium sp.]|jgi:LysM repeat protein|uniref:GDSL-type esterase/lipase family protein n=1 Tax=Flavobacterium sp. TaxID=239 RepID=UPI0037BFDA6A
MKNSILGLLFLLTSCVFAQEVDSTFVVIDSTIVDSIEVTFDKNDIQNASALVAFYERLYQLEQTKQGNLNIVHIGDSHIQADLFTARMRNKMQDSFGNAGFGFTFPYSVAKTNNSAPIRFNASGDFQSVRNLYADNSKQVGLSGIALETKSNNFSIQLEVKDPKYNFTSLKIITPQNADLFDVSVSSKNTIIETKVPKRVTHKVKPGEVLGGIADKYNVSLKALKKANGLKSDLIRDGKILIIPSKQLQPRFITKTEFVPIDLSPTIFSNDFQTEKPLNKIAIVPNQQINEFALNGLILGNNQSGVTYSGIGVNGAKSSDFNKFPLFFEQLKALQPDLIIISLGTNESFDKQTADQYFFQLDQMINSIKFKTPLATILITTPPPSVLHRKYTNTFIVDYAQKIKTRAHTTGYAVWDLFEVFGGNKNIFKNAAKGLMSRDKVHYSKAGYEKQADLFFEAFLKSYELYKSTK